MRKRIKNSLSIKVFLWVFAALTICSTIIYGVVLTVLPKQYQVAVESQLVTNVEMLFSELQNMSYEEAVKKIEDFCIRNDAEAILSDYEHELHFGKAEDNPSNDASEDDLSVAVSTAITTVSFSDNKIEHTLTVFSTSNTANKISEIMLSFLPVVLTIIILLSSLSALICSKVIVNPIAKISQISKRMDSLDLTWKCDIESDDEIGVLASNLNTMADRLHKTMEELTRANNQLTDDVEKFKALEEQRRNFFAAVSHELKTPLTILKGQIENMILGYGDYQNHEKYLPEALSAAESIEHLIKEIITISKTESMDLQDTLQEVSLVSTINETIETLLPLVRDKAIQLHQNIDRDIFLSVNLNLWHKVLSNVIGNAVRHSPYGEEIFISLNSCENGSSLVIENTGVYIPVDDFPHMFTPFYRADKSRSKATGGSGLGLYIVKTILDLHNLSYCIKNTDRGVAFILYLN